MVGRGGGRIVLRENADGKKQRGTQQFHSGSLAYGIARTGGRPLSKSRGRANAPGPPETPRGPQTPRDPPERAAAGRTPRAREHPRPRERSAVRFRWPVSRNSRVHLPPAGRVCRPDYLPSCARFTPLMMVVSGSMQTKSRGCAIRARRQPDGRDRVFGSEARLHRLAAGFDREVRAALRIAHQVGEAVVQCTAPERQWIRVSRAAAFRRSECCARPGSRACARECAPPSHRAGCPGI